MSKTAQKGIVDPKIIIGGIVVLVVIFFLATGNFKFSASRSDQPPSSQTASSQTENSQKESRNEQPQATATPKSYQNDQYKFSLQYPDSWRVKESQGQYVAAFFSPEESSSDKYLEYLGVKAISTSAKPDITLQEAADLWEEQTKKESTANNFTVVDRKSSTVAGKEAKDLVYTVDIKSIPAKGFVRLVLTDKNIYIFQYYAETDKYEKYLPDIEGIISSVTL